MRGVILAYRRGGGGVCERGSWTDMLTPVFHGPHGALITTNIKQGPPRSEVVLIIPFNATDQGYFGGFFGEKTHRT